MPKGWLELADLSSPGWEAQLGFLVLLSAGAAGEVAHLGQAQLGQLRSALVSSSLEWQASQGRLFSR